MTTDIQVVLVNEKGEEQGTMEKIEAHKKGVLHNAFSVFLFNEAGEMLIQKRADGKYHAAGLWSNTCCGHPQPGEDSKEAAQKRLFEEMGIQADLTYAFDFIYKTELENGMTEHELDQVYYGIARGKVSPAPEEVSDFDFVDPLVLQEDISTNPDRYTPWFRICLSRVIREVIPEMK